MEVNQASSSSNIFKKGALIIIGLLVLADLGFLNYDSISKKIGLTPINNYDDVSKSLPTPTIFESPKMPSSLISESCPQSCLEAVSKATSSSLPLVSPNPSVNFPSYAKEIYIPLGTSSTASKDWDDLTGIESVIDLENYPPIKSAIFEATMRIPTANGKVYAKLYNVTDKHDVWLSEVSAEGPNGYRAESKEISLATGRKLYRVMMKSTMGYEAILDFARIKIILK